LDAELQELIESATLALGRLDGLTTSLPDPTLFIYSYVRKEAVLSSQIEGNPIEPVDLLLFEVEGTASVPLDDVQEVSRYTAAMNYGLERLKELPLSLRLIKEIHGVLLTKGRGSQQEPANSADRKIGSAGRDRATPSSCHRHRRALDRMPRGVGKVPAQRTGKDTVADQSRHGPRPV